MNNYIFVECCVSDTVCEYKNCKQEAVWERSDSIEDDLDNIFSHRCDNHKLI